MKRRHEKPIPRVNPSGRKVWIARYTDRHGKRKSAGTFDLKGPCRSESPRADCCGQHAIDAAYDRDHQAPRRPDTVGAYAETWTLRHPRAERTNETNRHRVGRVLEVVVGGRRFCDWPMAEVARRQIADLVDVLLREQGRSAKGAIGIVRVLSAMWEDAIDDEVARFNPCRGVRIRANDPRVRKLPRAVRVWSWEQMHGFARAAGAARTPARLVAARDGAGGPVEGFREVPSEMDLWRPVYAEAMVRVLSDCGLRLGELLALHRTDVHDGLLEVRRTAHRGRLLDGTKTDHGEAGAGRLAPIPGGLAVLLAGLPARIDSRLLFPTPRGAVWGERNFYRDVWQPARDGAGIDPRPHEFRHSYVSLLRAARVVDDADLAAMAGHSVGTMLEHYTHALGRSYDVVREAVGT